MQDPIRMFGEWKLISSSSYVGLNQEDLPFLRRLGHLAIRWVKIEGEPELVVDTGVLEYFLEIISVYGHVTLAGEEIRKYQADVPGNMIHAKYHFYALVFNAKAFLDKIAAYLNWDYALGFRHGAIDLKNPRFLPSLRRRNPSLARQLAPLQKWVVEVVRWRDHLIHRQGIWVTPVTTPGVRRYARAARQILIPRQPEGSPGLRGGSTTMPRLAARWLKNARNLLRIVSEDCSRRVVSTWPPGEADPSRLGPLEPLDVKKGHTPEWLQLPTP